ncbi:hypothetical protein HPB51_001809 [Rhipicephalus microplus]|uniref:Uncharacterized protein n=1 Tax=Rhipicephalus microplus TaxID=6941 RepID=A0A9J6EW97_RHIMP|nr:hypothetical protein HPB51_001809 [Rhipicephalus microplus]
MSIQSLVGDNIHDHGRVQYERVRVAVCDQVNAALKEDAKLPPAFRKIILECFHESYGKYEDAVKARLQTGWKLDAMFEAAKPAEYEKLLTRLQSLKHKVEEKKEAGAAAVAAAAQAAAAENQNY